MTNESALTSNSVLERGKHGEPAQVPYSRVGECRLLWSLSNAQRQLRKRRLVPATADWII